MEEDGGNTISNEATEPFTMTSIQPELLKDAVDEAKNKVFDFVAEEIAGVFSIEDAAPAWATAISKETFDEIQEEVINCFEGLGDDQLKHLEEVADSLSGFTTDKAFETLLDPEDRPSCSLPNVSPASLSGLPDIPEGALDPAKELSSYLYSCLAKTIGDVDLGSIMNPTNNRRDRRDLEENVCPVPPAVPPQTFGVTFALSLGIDANVDVGIQTPSTQYDLTVGSSLGSVTIEAGYDIGKKIIPDIKEMKNEEISEMVHSIDGTLEKWIIKKINTWQGKNEVEDFLHLHGDKDPVFPIKNIKDYELIKDGNHNMIILKSQEIRDRVVEFLG